MGSDTDIYKLLGCVAEDGELLDFPEWDLLRELDNREKRKNSPARKEANRRSHKRNFAYRKYNNRYHREVVSPRRKATRLWMREHPEEVNEIRRKYEQQQSEVYMVSSTNQPGRL